MTRASDDDDEPITFNSASPLIKLRLRQILKTTGISIDNDNNDFDYLRVMCQSLMSDSGGIKKLVQAGFVELVCDIIMNLDGSADPYLHSLVSLGTSLRSHASWCYIDSSLTIC